ncbi:MAG TPA: porin [Azospirillaceae bacterium]|nr:porin [Azospirillaceae bacterium]
MKKILLASTAIIGLGFFAGSALAAESKVTVGGSVDFQAGFFDDEADATGNDRDFRNNTEVHVKADIKADNGLEYGASIEIESNSGAANSALDYDEAYLYVQGSWGRIEAGDQDGVVYQMSIYAPVVGIGQLDGDQYDWLSDGTLGAYPFFVDLQDNTKISYFSPRVVGFQVGVSYSPELDQGDSIVRTGATRLAAGESNDIFEAVLNYNGEFSGVTVEGSAGLLTANGDNATAAGSEFTSWNAGLRLGYAGFQVGGGYADFDEAAAADGAEDAWNVGVAYTAGNFGVAANYAYVDYDTDGVNQYALGGTYTVAPGLSVNADFVYADNEVTNNDGSVLILGTKLAF